MPKIERVANGDVVLTRSKTALVDLKRADFRFECRTRNAKPCRRSCSSKDPSIAGAQGLLDDRLLMAGKRSGQYDR